MTTATIIADAIVGLLASGSFSVSFVPERTWLPKFSIEEISQARAFVVPRTNEATRATRESMFYDYVVDIGIVKHVRSEAEIDALDAFAEEVLDFMLNQPVSDAELIATTRDPVVSPEKYDEESTFFTIISITYRVMK